MVRWSYALLASLLLATAARAQTVNLSFDATRTIRVVDERVFGVNAVMWDWQMTNPVTIGLLQSAGIRVLRIPGGSSSDSFHWKTGTAGNDWGMYAFSQLIGGVNAQAFVTVNYGSGTQQEAAAWVAYANASATMQGSASDVSLGVDSNGTDWRTAGYWSALRAAAPLATDDGLNYMRLNHPAPFDLKYWEMGNENYGTWETPDNHTVQFDAYTYANTFQLFRALMKAVDPSIKVGVVIPLGEDSYANTNGSTRAHPALNPRTHVTHYGWGPVLLSTLRTLGVTPDFATYHRYEQAPGQENDAALLMAPEQGTSFSGQSWAADASELRQELKDYLDTTAAPGADASVELLVGEDNSVYTTPGKQSTSLVNGLYLADTLGSILKTEFNSLVWWDLRNGEDNSKNNSTSLYGWRLYGDYGILATSPGQSWGDPSSFDAYPAYYTMKLMSHFARGGDSVIGATTDNPLLSAYAVHRQDNSVTLLVINKSPTASYNANIAIAGYTPQSGATVYSYGIPQDNAAKAGISASFSSSWENTMNNWVNQSGPDNAANNWGLNPPFLYSIGYSTTTGVTSGTYSLACTAASNPGDCMVIQNSQASVGTALSTGSKISFDVYPSVAGTGGFAQAVVYINGSNIAYQTLGTQDLVLNQENTATFTLTDAQRAGIAASLGSGQWFQTGIIVNTASPITAYFDNYYITPVAGSGSSGNPGSPDIAVSSLSNAAAAFTASFAPYSATVVVLQPAPAAPTITLQPVGQTANSGYGASFSVTATGAPAPSCRWQVSTDGGSTWANLGDAAPYSGTATATLKITGAATSLNGYQYRCVATNGVSPAATSNAAALTVRVSTNDFTGSGQPDLLWQNLNTGECNIQLMTGTTMGGEVSLGAISTAWRIAGSGDFNGDNQSDILWQNSTTGEYGIYLMNGAAVSSWVSLGSVPTAWQIAGVGDFNGDGKPDILFQNASTGERGIYLMNGTSVTGWVSLASVATAWQIVGAGDFNGDGKTDILWQNTATGECGIYLMNGTAVTGWVSLGVLPIVRQIAGVGDFNGDGKTDILWQNMANGQRGVYLMNGTTVTGQVLLGTVSTAWSLGGNGVVPQSRSNPDDFNGDGQSDIVWQNTATGERGFYLMNGAAVTSWASLATVPIAWQIAGTADFNGDGQTDILWQNTTTGEYGLYLMNGTAVASWVSLGSVPTVWQIAGTGDFNGDGQTDILWQNTATGERGLYLMNGTTVTSWVSLPGVPVAWQIVGTGDFNGDGQTDILWQNTATGEYGLYLMNGTAVTSWVSLGSVPTAWQIAGTGDFNGDGQTDILWQNTTTGERGIYLMNGAAVTGWVSLGTVSTDWSMKN